MDFEDISGSASAPPAYGDLPFEVQLTQIPAERLHLYLQPDQGIRIPLDGPEELESDSISKPLLGGSSEDVVVTSPDALLQRIFEVAKTPPKLFVSCFGSHQETRHRHGTEQVNGSTRQVTQSEQVSVTDFDFKIDVTALLPSIHNGGGESIRLSIPPPTEPTYRGSSRLTYHPIIPSNSKDRPYRHIRLLSEGKLECTMVGRRASRAERGRLSKWKSFRREKGLPYWTPRLEEYQDSLNGKGKKRAAQDSTPRSLEDGPSPQTVLATQIAEAEVADLQQWCQAFCESHLEFRQFVVKKEVWGWEMGKLEKAIEGVIQSTGYVGNTIKVECKLQEEEVMVRPPTWYNRWRENTWLLVLLCITLVYPIFLLVEYFRRARWEVVTISYPIKAYVPSHVDHDAKNPKLMSDDSAIPSYHLQGYQEGKWLREWEPAVRKAVYKRHQGILDHSTFPSAPGPDNGDPRELLDGYMV